MGTTIRRVQALTHRLYMLSGFHEAAAATAVGSRPMQLRHYRNGHGDPLVLIHGIGSRWQMWEPVIDRLVAHRDVIALDLPGFGASPMPPPGTPPGVDSLASLVAGFLAGLGVERPHVAGNSLGGLIALELARRGQVRSATAISPAGFANRPESVVARASLRVSVRLARRLERSADTLLATRPARQAALSLFFAHPARVSAAEAAASVRALAGAPWFDATLPTIRARAITGGEGITVPVTVAWGDRDRLLPPRQARRAARAIPAARIVTLPSCGHVPTYDDPARVASVLLEGSAGT
jgi:pimeloyl-ACP methyl ester carboxylesterase